MGIGVGLKGLRPKSESTPPPFSYFSFHATLPNTGADTDTGSRPRSE